MTTVQPAWLDRVADRLRQLGARPALLFLVLLTANALARPYANFAHDARLYSVQVLNQVEPGSYADDLFLRFGSQDQFSLFSRAAAPLVATFGLEVTFFALYLFFNSLFLLALQRLILALATDRVIAVLALLYLVIAPLPFGGLGTFYVHEPFMTPRIMANALVLFGLERLLARRYALAFLLMLTAGTMHPLMAQGGLIIWLLVVAWDVLPRWAFLALLNLGIVAASAVVLYEPAGLALFGRMDEEWREIVRLASAYNFPDEWMPADWLNIALSLWLVAFAAVRLEKEDPERSRFLGIAAFTGLAGLIGTVIGSMTSYAFLFQAQPYRALWIVKVLQAPAGFWLASHLWRSARPLPRLAAALIVAGFWISCFSLLEIAFPLFFLPVLAVSFRGLDTEPRGPDWLERSAVYSLVLGCCGWALYKVGLILKGAGELAPLLDGLDYARLLIDQLGPMVWLILVLTLVAFLLMPRMTVLRAATVLAIGVMFQFAFFIVSNLRSYREEGTRYQRDMVELADFLERHRRPGDARPTVYCCLGRIDYVWIDLKAQSYFDWAQIVGCLFNRGNAAEGHRRALLVRAFEIDRFQEHAKFLDDSRRRSIEKLFQCDLELTTPTEADLVRLCLDEDVDFVVLKQRFPGLTTASFGRMHLYDCRQVRLALRGAPRPAVTTMTPPRPPLAGALAASPSRATTTQEVTSP